MTDIQDWLDERARIRNRSDDGDFEDVNDAIAMFPKALTALRNVRNFCIAAHLPVGNYGEYGQGYNKALNEVMSALQEAINDDE